MVWSEFWDVYQQHPFMWSCMMAGAIAMAVPSAIGKNGGMRDHLFDLLTLGIFLFGVVLILQTHQEPRDGSY